MNAAEELAVAVVSLRETVRLLQNVAIVYPDAEAEVKAMSMAENTPEGVRAMLKVLLAMGTFALAQERAEQTLHVLAEAQQSAGTTRWVN